MFLSFVSGLSYFVGICTLIGALIGLVRPAIVGAPTRRVAVSRYWLLTGVAFAMGATTLPDTSWWAGLSVVGLFGIVQAFLTPYPFRLPVRFLVALAGVAVFVIGAIRDESSAPVRAARGRERAAAHALAAAEAGQEAAARAADSLALATFARRGVTRADLLSADAHLHGKPTVPNHPHERFIEAALDSMSIAVRARRLDEQALRGLTAQLTALRGPLTPAQVTSRDQLLRRVLQRLEAQIKAAGEESRPGPLRVPAIGSSGRLKAETLVSSSRDWWDDTHTLAYVPSGTRVRVLDTEVINDTGVSGWGYARCRIAIADAGIRGWVFCSDIQ